MSMPDAVLQAVVLDLDSLRPSDLDLSPLLGIENVLAEKSDSVEIQWTTYGMTSAEEVAERIAQAQIVITNKVVLDAAVLAQAPELNCVLVAATGTNNVDLEACFSRDIQVCNVRDYGAQAVAQHTMALLLALAGSLPQYDQAVREGRWSQSPFFCLFDYPVVELAGKTLGIVGYGAIGQAVARMARAFDMSIMVAESLGAQTGRSGGDPAVVRYPLERVLAQADVLSLHCPLTPETHHLIDEQALALMKPSAFLVNTGRGPLIAPRALLAALQSGGLAGAGLDVLTEEPALPDDLLVQAHLPNLIITPHMAWTSVPARQNIIDQVAASLREWLGGCKPARCLNP